MNDTSLVEHMESSHWRVLLWVRKRTNNGNGTFRRGAVQHAHTASALQSLSHFLAIYLLHQRPQDEPENATDLAKSSVDSTYCDFQLNILMRLTNTFLATICVPLGFLLVPLASWLHGRGYSWELFSNYPSKSHMPWTLPAKYTFLQPLKYDLFPGMPPVINKISTMGFDVKVDKISMLWRN